MMSTIDMLLAERAKTINLNAGPSPLPLNTLLSAANSLLSYPDTAGMGIAEISHRSSAFQKIMDDADRDLKSLLEIPNNYKILWMQGGGLTQFATTVLNLLAWYRIKHQLAPEDEVVGEYVVTGSWSKKAAEEGLRMGIKTHIIVDGKKTGKGSFESVPPLAEWVLSAHKRIAESSATFGAQRKPAFVYYCDNETVDGVEFPTETEKPTRQQPFPFEDLDPDVPVVCDMSSNFLSRPVDVSKYGIIYAGAQKNLGPAGVTVVIVREDLIVDLDAALPFGGIRVPSMLSYKNMAESGSMYNTPPTFTIYVCGLVMRSLLESPPKPREPSSRPLSAQADLAFKKSQLVYKVIDGSESFYVGTAEKASRSRMNVTFRLNGGVALEKEFISAASTKGIRGVAGHRSVGGVRTSLYNAVSLEQVQLLALFMEEFKILHKSKLLA